MNTGKYTAVEKRGMIKSIVLGIFYTYYKRMLESQHQNVKIPVLLQEKSNITL
jgi:hypothetical protein